MPAYKIPDEILTGEHALCSPSASKRWLSCPASVYRSMGKDNVETQPARIGTAAHWVLEYCLHFMLESEAFLGSTAPNGIDIDEEICFNVQMALDWIREYAEQVNGTIYPETRSDIYKALGIDLPVVYGTVDVPIIHSDGGLTIADYKNGVWGVSVNKNTQLELYALGVIEKFNLKPETINLVIIQPRNGGIKQTTITYDDLLLNSLWYWYGVNRTLDTDAIANPSEDNCKFCLAKHDCEDRLVWKNRALIEMEQEYQELLE